MSEEAGRPRAWHMPADETTGERRSVFFGDADARAGGHDPATFSDTAQPGLRVKVEGPPGGVGGVPAIVERWNAVFAPESAQAVRRSQPRAERCATSLGEVLDTSPSFVMLVERAGARMYEAYTQTPGDHHAMVLAVLAGWNADLGVSYLDGMGGDATVLAERNAAVEDLVLGLLQSGVSAYVAWGVALLPEWHHYISPTSADFAARMHATEALLSAAHRRWLDDAMPQEGADDHACD